MVKCIRLSIRKGIKKVRELQLGRRIVRTAPGILFTLVTVVLFSRVGLLHKVQTFVVDTRMRLNDPPAESDVAIVQITDEDYKDIFQERSPLDPFNLKRLIEAISLGKPRLIAVDIDTSSPQFRDLKIDGRSPPIVWEREPKRVPLSDRELPEPLDVLGGQDPALNSDSGLPLLIEDSEDKVTRSYRRVVNTTIGPLPSFPWAIVRKAAIEKTRSLKESDDDFFIDYSPDPNGNHRFTITASTLFELTKQNALPDDNLFKDKIVLLGGLYLGQDLHDTPLGSLHGVEILAQVVETELQGGGDRSPTRLTIFSLEIFEAILVIILFQLFHKYAFVKALVINLLVLFLIAALCSIWTFGSFLRLTYFVPILVLVLAFEFLSEYRTHIVKVWFNGVNRRVTK